MKFRFRIAVVTVALLAGTVSTGATAFAAPTHSNTSSSSCRGCNHHESRQQERREFQRQERQEFRQERQEFRQERREERREQQQQEEQQQQCDFFFDDRNCDNRHNHNCCTR